MLHKHTHTHTSVILFLLPLPLSLLTSTLFFTNTHSYTQKLSKSHFTNTYSRGMSVDEKNIRLSTLCESLTDVRMCVCACVCLSASGQKAVRKKKKRDLCMEGKTPMVTVCTCLFSHTAKMSILPHKRRPRLTFTGCGTTHWWFAHILLIASLFIY